MNFLKRLFYGLPDTYIKREGEIFFGASEIGGDGIFFVRYQKRNNVAAALLITDYTENLNISYGTGHALETFYSITATDTWICMNLDEILYQIRFLDPEDP